MAGVLTVSVLMVVGLVSGGPVRTKTVDQRQQGELNIHAQLDNIVLVIIPSSRLNLLELATKNKFPGDKNSLLQLFQKPPKGDIDRYEVINDIPGDDPVITQQVILTQKGEKNEDEEEVVATVQEMDSATTPKAELKPEPTIEPKEQSTVSETVQESVLKISAPEESKDSVKLEEDKSKDSSTTAEDKPKKESTEKVEPKKEPTEDSKEDAQPKEKVSEEKESPRLFTEPDVKTLKELIRPVAAKEETAGPRLVEGVRREKVIKYKPETKWAPGLVDLLRPVAKGMDDRQRYATLCAPGVWDSELSTCIMPGETRSRTELARFLQAMRFGITLPSQ